MSEPTKEPKVLHRWDHGGLTVVLEERAGKLRAFGCAPDAHPYITEGPAYLLPEIASLASRLSAAEAENDSLTRLCADLQTDLTAAEAREEEMRKERVRDLAAMSRAMDALEADADPAARQQAFEIMQHRFENIGGEPDADGDWAESDEITAMVETLKQEHAQWESEGYGLWPGGEERIAARARALSEKRDAG